MRSPVEIDAFEHWVAPVQRLQRHPLVGPVPIGVVEAHGAGQAAEQLGIGHRFAERRDGRLVEREIEVPPREHDVELFELRGGRQHDVGITRGIGDEVLAHHGEQVLARKPLQHLVLLRHHDHGVRVVNEEGVDLLIELARECRAEPPLVDHRRAFVDPVGPAEAVPVHGESPDRHVQDAAAAMPPRADKSRDAGHRAHRIAAGGIALDGDTHADDGRLRGGEFARERADVIGRDPGDLGHLVRREIRGALRQLLVADRVVLDVVAIDQILGDDHVDHAKRQRRIGTGS